MQAIDEFLDQWTAAERAGDAATLDTLLTEDFVGVGPMGFTLPKAAARGHAIPPAGRTTLVLTDDGGQWRLSGAHLSFIAGTPGAPPAP